MKESELLERIKGDVSPIQSLLPKGTILIWDRVIYPDEIPVIAAAFFLVCPTDDPHKYENLVTDLDVSLWTEENPKKLCAALERWLKSKWTFKPLPHYPCRYFTKRILENREVFIPNAVPGDWDYYMTRGVYTFQEVLRSD